MKTLRLPALAFFCAVLAGCASPNFDAQWRAAARPRASEPFQERWSGTWQSSCGTHHGRLECVLTPAGPDRLRADFQAHWLSFSSRYQVILETRRMRHGLRFHGEKDLGAVYGGLYRYTGQVSRDHFEAGYESRFDTGTFTLQPVPNERRGKKAGD